jgi:hypothetical protein
MINTLGESEPKRLKYPQILASESVGQDHFIAAKRVTI